MKDHLLPSLRLVVFLTLVLGLLYPGAITLLARALFPYQAEGSLLTYRGKVVGSALIGQSFTEARFFWGRPSATVPPYNAAASGASNLGPTNPLLVEQVRRRLRALLLANPGVSPQAVPPDLVEASASGLDPDISPAAAYLQVPRVARANHLPVPVVHALVRRLVRGRFLGLFGEPHVNVVRLNFALLQLLNRTRR